MKAFKEKIRDLFDDYEKLVTRKNIPVEGGNGIFTRYQYPQMLTYGLLCNQTVFDLTY